MTYLPVSVVAAQLKIGPRRLRTLLAAGRIKGAYRLGLPHPCHGDGTCERYETGPWLIPADFTLSPASRGPLPNWRKP